MSASTSLAPVPVNVAAPAADPAGASRPAAGQTIDVYPGDIDALHGNLVRYFEEAEYSSYDARQLAEKCRDYFDGRQYTAAEVETLRRRRQPPVVNNYVKRKVELLRGLERRGRSDPKAFPRTPTEDNRADAATQALRYVADDQRYDVIRSDVFDNILIEGYGGCEVIVEPDPLTADYNVVINHIPWDRLFHDPHSRHPGFSDARYLGMVIWKDHDDAIGLYPGKEDILSATFEAGRSETYDDRPNNRWSDMKRRRVRIVQIHWKIGRDFWTATYTRGGFLEDPVKSPYIDRHGNAMCPLILRSAYCDRDLNRYGVVRDLISPQDSINKRESKLAHALNVNRIVMEEGAVDDEDRARVEAAKPDGLIKVNKGFEFAIQKDQAEIAGQFQLLQYAVSQMNVTGPNASMMGKDPRTQSGRAIIAQQAGGQVEHEPIADALRQHTHKVFESVWMRIKQFWTSEKWIRVTDNDKNVQFVGLNHPVTVAELLGKLDQTQPLPMQLRGMPPLDARAVQFGLQLPPGDPRLQLVVRIENEVSDINVDIDIEEGPDNPTLQDEQFQSIMQLPQQILMQFPPEFFIKASALRNKDELVKMLEEHAAAQAQDQAEAKDAAKRLQNAEIANKEADAADKRAQAVQRLHGMAVDHADLEHQPVLPGVGVVAPANNPLLTPSPAAAPVPPQAPFGGT